MKMVLVGKRSDAGKRLRSSVRLSDCGKQCALCRAHRDVYNVKCTLYTQWHLDVHFVHTVMCTTYNVQWHLGSNGIVCSISVHLVFVCTIVVHQVWKSNERAGTRSSSSFGHHFVPLRSCWEKQNNSTLTSDTENSNAQTQSFASHHLLLCEIMLGNKPTLLEQLISTGASSTTLLNYVDIKAQLHILKALLADTLYQWYLAGKQTNSIDLH